MSIAKKTPKKDFLLISIAIAFIAGFLCGAGFAVYKMEPAGVPAPAGQQNSMAEQQAEAIAHLESEVTADPENFQAWTQLGHLYFDTGQYDKAVQAYETSLSLHAGTADIYTDLGVMYRRTDRPQKAIDTFDKAIELDPDHQTARLNKGIVLLYDLEDIEGAIDSWESLLELNPEAAAGDGTPIRVLVNQLKEQPGRQQQ